MKDKAKTISMLDVDSILGAFYDEKEENAVMDVEERWSYTINDIADRLYSFRDYVIEQREEVISQRALDTYNNIIERINHFLGEDYLEDDFVLDEAHIEELKEARKVEALNNQLSDLESERQRYLDAIEESEALISKLKERNADPSIIADEQALIDQNKACIEQLDKQIAELSDQNTPSLS
jgi:DNA repair exonuclease SbcCD ATPase subunit